MQTSLDLPAIMMGHASHAATMTLPAFDEYHRRRSGAVLRYATAIVGPNAAEDACQEAWFRAWRAWGTAEDDHLDAWVFRIVRNCCVDRLRATRPTRALDPDALPWQPPAEDAALASVEASRADQLLRRLSPPLYEVLLLREVLDLAYAEIAEVQGVPIGTVMSRLYVARRRAARLLREAGL